ncbi:NADPH-dependent FMN reductase [Rapidithrix thailandica]|uniref:NADPH-dependent FMN reductase n=1 Tax=Rapidithrix thailandica TaxID=413964 RepID=A0AAW9S6U8_9BACT
MKKILAFSGSNSSSSINQALVKYTPKIIDDASVQVNVIDLTEYQAPFYSSDIEQAEGHPENILKLKALIDSYDGFIISLPEHNGSFPAFFKNTIDWLSRTGMKFLGGKPVLLMSTSPGKNGGRTVLEHAAGIFPYLGANIVAKYSLGEFQKNLVDGELINEAEAKLLQDATNKLKAGVREATNVA